MNVQKLLEKELKRLQALFPFGGYFKVVWLPEGGGVTDWKGEKHELKGQVIGDTIYLYDSDSKEAISTLRHEFIESIVKDEFLKPYVDYINALTRAFDDLSYERQEKIIEGLSRLISKILNKKGNGKDGEDK